MNNKHTIIILLLLLSTSTFAKEKKEKYTAAEMRKVDSLTITHQNIVDSLGVTIASTEEAETLAQELINYPRIDTADNWLSQKVYTEKYDKKGNIVYHFERQWDTYISSRQHREYVKYEKRYDEKGRTILYKDYADFNDKPYKSIIYIYDGDKVSIKQEFSNGYHDESLRFKQATYYSYHSNGEVQSICTSRSKKLQEKRLDSRTAVFNEKGQIVEEYDERFNNKEDYTTYHYDQYGALDLECKYNQQHELMKKIVIDNISEDKIKKKEVFRQEDWSDSLTLDSSEEYTYSPDTITKIEYEPRNIPNRIYSGEVNISSPDGRYTEERGLCFDYEQEQWYPSYISYDKQDSHHNNTINFYVLYDSYSERYGDVYTINFYTNDYNEKDQVIEHNDYAYKKGMNFYFEQDTNFVDIRNPFSDHRIYSEFKEILQYSEDGCTLRLHLERDAYNEPWRPRDLENNVYSKKGDLIQSINFEYNDSNQQFEERGKTVYAYNRKEGNKYEISYTYNYRTKEYTLKEMLISHYDDYRNDDVEYLLNIHGVHTIEDRRLLYLHSYLWNKEEEQWEIYERKENQYGYKKRLVGCTLYHRSDVTDEYRPGVNDIYDSFNFSM